MFVNLSLTLLFHSGYSCAERLQKENLSSHFEQAVKIKPRVISSLDHFLARCRLFYCLFLIARIRSLHHHQPPEPPDLRGASCTPDKLLTPPAPPIQLYRQCLLTPPPFYLGTPTPNPNER